MSQALKTNQAGRPGFRRFWLQLHLYLGLSVGVVFVLLGLTGSLLVFYTTLDNLALPAVSTPAPPVINPATQQVGTDVQQGVSQTVAPSPQAILDKLRADFPDRSAGWRIELPLHASDPVLARYLKPAETRQQHFAPLMVTLDPHTLEITSQRLWGDTVMTWIYDLHYTLLLDVNGKIPVDGKTVLAIISIMLLVSLLSGVYLWWPQKNASYAKNALSRQVGQVVRQGRNWRKAFAYRRHAHLYKRIYDWHKLSGVYGLLLLLVLVLSGLMLEKPSWFEGWIGAKHGLQHMGSAATPPEHNHIVPAALSLDQMAQTALAQFPGSRLRWIYTPDSAQGQYQFRLYQQGEPGLRFPKTTVQFDLQGKMLGKHDYFTDSAGDKLLNWLHPLHNGEAFGLLGRWLVLLSGLLPLLLFVTGWLRWRHKRRAAQVMLMQAGMRQGL